ncbi:hypothetical protein C1H46_023491 [Malus baccata]|uniref:Uncharacterized protein n=1 Tax=Malus baccata TaxID=106549 RepID=A0A540LWT8_MALBA|nr:hypothetical protein C1H46_023491 [Malus baccata]
MNGTMKANSMLTVQSNSSSSFMASLLSSGGVAAYELSSHVARHKAGAVVGRVACMGSKTESGGLTIKYMAYSA